MNALKSNAFVGGGSANSAGVVNVEMKLEFKEKLINFCVGDIRPFNLAEGTNFSEVVQAAIDLGAKHGNVNAEDLFPSVTTISRGVNNKADKAHEIVKPTILKALHEGCLSASIDMWQDDYKYLFFTKTAHFINDDWQLVNLILFTTVFAYDSATAGNIKKALLDNL